MEKNMDESKKAGLRQTGLPFYSRDQGTQTKPSYITSSYTFSGENMSKGVAQVRAVGGSLIVTIPRKVVEKEGLHAGEWVKLDVKKVKKDYFGCLPGVGSFTKEDEFKGQLD